jgi:hypothetical protein
MSNFYHYRIFLRLKKFVIHVLQHKPLNFNCVNDPCKPNTEKFENSTNVQDLNTRYILCTWHNFVWSAWPTKKLRVLRVFQFTLTVSLCKFFHWRIFQQKIFETISDCYKQSLVWLLHTSTNLSIHLTPTHPGT